MKSRYIAAALVFPASIWLAGAAVVSKDRFALKSPNGIAISEFKGYEKWQMIASAVADNASGCGSSPEPGCIKSILGNSVAIKAYEAGIPFNGQPVPDGARYAKIEWYKHHVVEIYGATIPGKFMEVAFMVKDAKRFPDTNGWGYATVVNDEAAGGFKVKGDSPAFGKAECHGCHTVVKAHDYLFTKYPPR